MKLTYLGTAAAEGFPATFCNCQFCVEARLLGGKNVRTRSQSLVNDDLLIDFPADTYFHFLNHKIDVNKIKYLLITHAHPDHLYQEDLYRRRRPYAHNIATDILPIVCSEHTSKAINGTPAGTKTIVIKAFETVKLGEYEITALPARHMLEGEEAFIYIIRGDKTLLYANDTGFFFEDVFSYIEENKVFFDMVSLDCTNIDIPISDGGSHMGFPNIERLLSRLSAIGAVNSSTVKYVNHFSHNANPIHSVVEEKAKKHGCLASYDGCTVDF